MQKYDFEIIGTHLFLSLDTPEDMESIFASIQTRCDRFEKRFSRFITGNWLYDMNHDRRGILDADAKNMLFPMLALAEKSHGYFDPTVGRRLTELGYGNRESSGSQIEQKSGHGDYRDIEISGDEVILHGDISLEFGGIGKGYLIDLIREMLDGVYPDISRYLINFGGDIYGKGAWKVGLESPFAEDEVIGTIVIDDISLACSAGTRRRWGTHHHLIDPHTGESAREVVASYIESSTAMMADSYATTLCVMPWSLAVATLEETPEISGVIVRHDGTLFQKEGSRAEVFI